MLKKISTIFIFTLFLNFNAKSQSMGLGKLYFLGYNKELTYEKNQVDLIDIALSHMHLKNKKLKSKMGFYDIKGNIIIPAKYNNALDFRGGYANIFIDSLYGYIYKNGSVKLFPNYDEVFWFHDSIGISKKK